MTQHIIGLGTGRCGTRSLAKLLGLQPGVYATHEAAPVLRWYDEIDPGRHIRVSHSDAEIIADVGFYYLPHVERIRQEFSGVRFICLQRDRDETVDSFCRQLPRSKDWFHDAGSPWSVSFPTIRVNSFRDQAAAYWDGYYALADQLEQSGDDFRIFPTEALTNDPESILEFCGFDSPVVEACHVGAGVP